MKKDAIVSNDEYLRMIELKTASLIAASVRLVHSSEEMTRKH